MIKIVVLTMLKPKNLLFKMLVALLFNGCVNTTPIYLTGKQFYLITAQQGDSKYEQVSLQFKDNQRVEIYAMLNLHVGDVTMGTYRIENNWITLPKIGTFKLSRAKDGFDLFTRDNKLKYKMTSKMSRYSNGKSKSTVPNIKTQAI